MRRHRKLRAEEPSGVWLALSEVETALIDAEGAAVVLAEINLGTAPAGYVWTVNRLLSHIKEIRASLNPAISLASRSGRIAA